MNILLLGDIVGRSGRTALSCYIDKLIAQYNVDFVIVNGENSAHGKGITPRIYQQFLDLGVGAITLGNHATSKPVILDTLENMDALVYPNNHPCIVNNQGVKHFTVNNQLIAVVNILGNAFMKPEPNESCFDCMHACLKQINEDEIVIVDFHGEATAEKRAFFETFKSQCSIIVGTHTHVQTADEMIKEGCAFITDLGMVGAFDSVLGRDINESLQLYKGKKSRYLPSDNPAIICGVVVTIDTESKNATDIQRIQIRP